MNCRPLWTEDQGALIIGDFETQYMPPADLITNSVIRNSAGFGIDAIWKSGTFAPDLRSGNVFTNNAGCDQTLNTPLSTCSSHGCQGP